MVCESPMVMYLMMLIGSVFVYFNLLKYVLTKVLPGMYISMAYVQVRACPRVCWVLHGKVAMAGAQILPQPLTSFGSFLPIMAISESSGMGCGFSTFSTVWPSRG